MRFGIITPPVPGHLHPFGALGRELIARGHSVTVFHVPDLEQQVRREGLEFIPIAEKEFPKGALAQSLAAVGARQGLAALRFTIGEVVKTTRAMLREAPAAMRNAQMSMLLSDQTEPAGGAIADRLGLPFVTVCNALALNREPDIPPPFSPWKYRPSGWSRVRNQLGYAVADRLTSPIAAVVNEFRRSWNLRPHRSMNESFSPSAQISQQPREFDFPRRELPDTFHYVGPLRRPGKNTTPFPWDRLDGRPLIYASLGTLQNSRLEVFRCFAEACKGLDAQLAITHGGGLTEEEAASLPGSPLAVRYAPQIEVLSRARLTLTHAGLNTVLDSLSCGVPMIAVPITYEQPAIAQRIRYAGVGETLSLRALSARRLRSVVSRMLEDGSPHLAAAAGVARSIRDAGNSVENAARIILGP